jgi:hypothetical protein
MKAAGILDALVLLALSAASAPAQTAISPRAGLISRTEGRVFLNGQVLPATSLVAQMDAQEGSTAQWGAHSGLSGLQVVELDAIRMQTGRFLLMSPQDVLTTEEGRAEVLLNPGSFLRVGDGSAVRLVSDSSTHPSYEVVSGASVLEIAELNRDASLTVLFRGVTIMPSKPGLYRVDTNLAVLRVLDGEAFVQSGGRRARIGEGRRLALDGSWTISRFDPGRTDALDRWSRGRAEYLAMANIPTARHSAAYSQDCHEGLWVLNLLYGTMTYVPCGGIYRSHYGYNFYSYRRVLPLFTSQPPQRKDALDVGDLQGTNSYPAFRTNEATSAGTSGTIAAGSPASTTASSASTSAISRDSGNAGGQTR